MITKVAHNTREVLDFPELVALYDNSELRSPLRSTIPLLAYWRTPGDALSRFSRVLGLGPDRHTLLSFEHPVPVQRGRGKASFTDLMLIFDDVTVAVEAKSTEPPYQTVDKWLRGARNGNRSEVLSGWLDLIASVAGRRLTEENVRDCSYQLIHRTASACAMESRRRMVVYQCFDATDRMHEYYRKQLTHLRLLTGGRSGLEFWLVQTTLDRSAPYSELVRAWNLNRSDAASGIRKGLLEGSLFSVSKETGTRV